MTFMCGAEKRLYKNPIQSLHEQKKNTPDQVAGLIFVFFFCIPFKFPFYLGGGDIGPSSGDF